MPLGNTFSITIDNAQVLKHLHVFGSKAAQQRVLVQRLRSIMQKSIDLTFNQEGVPAGLWRRVTQSGRAGIPRKILQLSGKLRTSIRERVEHGEGISTLTYYSLSRYASIHQRGGVVRARRKPYLVFMYWNGSGFSWASKKAVRIPATPFLIFRPEDRQLLKKEILVYFTQEG